MKKEFLIKAAAVAIVLIIGLLGFYFSPKSEMQIANPSKTPANVLEGRFEVNGYKNWTKVNDQPALMISRVALSCVRPTQAESEMESKNPHTDKYINVYVNPLGKDE